MRLLDAYPVVVTDRLRECRDFYCRWFRSPTHGPNTSGSRGGVELTLGLTDEPWGQRRFGVVDPAGMWADVVEQIEPAPGWWDPYVAG